MFVKEWKIINQDLPEVTPEVKADINEQKKIDDAIVNVLTGQTNNGEKEKCSDLISGKVGQSILASGK